MTKENDGKDNDGNEKITIFGIYFFNLNYNLGCKMNFMFLNQVSI